MQLIQVDSLRILSYSNKTNHHICNKKNIVTLLVYISESERSGATGTKQVNQQQEISQER